MNGTEHLRQEELKETPLPENDRRMGELLGDFSHYIYELVGKQFELAKIELSQKLENVEKDTRFYLTGVSVAYAGLLFVLVAIVLALSTVIPLVLSAFLVGVVAIGAGSTMMYMGRKRLREEDLMPRKTMKILRGDKEWMDRTM